MKEILLILVPIVIFGILITGGLQITDPQKVGPVSNLVTDLVDQAFEPQKTLQIRALGKAGAITPSPTSPPGTSYTAPPFITQPPPPTSRPTATPIPPLCQDDRVAFNVLIDTSGSLSTQLAGLQDALRSFANYLGSDTIFGAQEFNINATDFVSIGRFNRTAFLDKINRMQLSGRDETYMVRGFNFAKNRVDQARGSYSGYNWKFIFVSDGIPNDNSDPREGPDGTQNPTQIVRSMWGNTQIYTVGVGIGLLPVNGSLAVWTRTDVRNYATGLMNGLSNTGPVRSAIDSTQIRPIFDAIAQESCR